MKAPLAAFLFSLGLNLTGHSILPSAFFVSSSEIADEVNSATAAGANKDGKTTPFIPDENTYARIKATRSRRMAEQRERVRQKIASGEFDAKYGPNADNSDSNANKAQSEGGQFHRITEEQLNTLVNNAYETDPNLTKRNHEWIKRGNLREALNDPRRRDLWGSSINRDPYATPSGMADSSQEYEPWQQAFRKIGDFVDCSNMFYNGGGSHDSGDNEGKCAHWTLWCAYVDPYYTGNGYYEYNGDNAPGSLSCHKPDSGWLMIGCYAQELYQFYEQLSKHVW